MNVATVQHTLSSLRQTRVAWLAAAISIASAACLTSPDTEERLDDYRSVVEFIDFEVPAGCEEGSGEAPNACGLDAVPNPEGVWFFAMSANIGRDRPLYMQMTVTEVDPVTLQFEAQPLVRDFVDNDGAPMEGARTFAGDPLPTVTGTYCPSGKFHVEFTGVTVIGDANPLTFRDIGGDLILDGKFLNGDIVTGAMSGGVTSPTSVPLGGSTFAGVRVSAENFMSIDPIYYNDTIPCEVWF